MTRIMYSSDGERWWRTEWVSQCEEQIILADQCQGVKGHEGEHWCYRPSGDYAWSGDDGCGWTPPGHESYRTPESMQEHHHLQFRDCEEITDPEIAERLEQDDPPEGIDNCSIDKPLAEDDPWYDECQRRLEEFRMNDEI